MSSKIEKVPAEVQQAFSRFCRQHGWTEAEILTLQMLSAIKEGPDLVVGVIKQRQLRQKHLKWFTRLPFWPIDSQLEE